MKVKAKTLDWKNSWRHRNKTIEKQKDKSFSSLIHTQKKNPW